MSESKNYYIVVAGEVKPYDPCHEEDWDVAGYDSVEDAEEHYADWCVVYAHDEADASRIADLYDTGKIDYDNVWCQTCNHPHPAINDKEN